jgi:hypothetical protein
VFCCELVCVEICEWAGSHSEAGFFVLEFAVDGPVDLARLLHKLRFHHTNQQCIQVSQKAERMLTVVPALLKPFFKLATFSGLSNNPKIRVKNQSSLPRPVHRCECQQYCGYIE